MLSPLPALPFGQRAVPLLPSAGSHAIGRMHRTGSYNAAAAASSGLRLDQIVVEDQLGRFFVLTLPKDIMLTTGGNLDPLPLVRNNSIDGCVADQNAGVDAIDEFSAYIDETIQLP